jgi:hypothetical protein
MEAKSMPESISDGLILAIIDKGLDSLGQSGKQALWFYFEKDFGFNRKNVPENLPAFQETLQKFFGMGYSFLDTLFRKYLQEATGEHLEGYESFVEAVKVLRSHATLSISVNSVWNAPTLQKDSQ